MNVNISVSDDDDDELKIVKRKEKFLQPPLSPIIGTSASGSSSSREQQPFGINLAAHESVTPSLRELCSAHGVQPHNAHLYMTKVDLFQPVDFSLQTLDTFSKLIEVIVIQAPKVTSLVGLSACRHLKKLFVIECSLTSLAGLEELTSLTHLCLDGNGISRIRDEYFNGCGHSLQVLSLNENRIPRIEGLWRCTRLRELSLARNFISAIGDGVGELEDEVSACFHSTINKNNRHHRDESSTFDPSSLSSPFLWPSPGYEDGTLSGLSNLTLLQLAGNRLSSFRDIYRLSSQLPSLRHLFLNDPHWGSNPVCSLANYTTFALCLLPFHVKSLDSIRITPEARVRAETKFNRKSMHYSMRTRRVKRSIIAVQETAKLVAEKIISLLSLSIPSLHFAIKILEAHISAAEDEINAIYSLTVPISSSSLSVALSSEASTANVHVDNNPLPIGIQDSTGAQDIIHSLPILSSSSLVSSSSSSTSIPPPKSLLLAYSTWPPLRPLAGLPISLPPILAAAKAKLSILKNLLLKREVNICALNEALASLNISARTCAAIHSERIDVELNTGRNTKFEEVLPSTYYRFNSSSISQQVTMNHMMMASPVKLISSLSTASSSASTTTPPTAREASIFSACSRFLKSRFSKESFSCLHVADVKVTRVVKISNNQLRARFEKRVAALIDTVPFLKQAIDEFFTPHCNSSLTKTEEKRENDDENEKSSEGSNGEGNMSLKTAMSILLGDSGMKPGVDFVMFSPRWGAVSTPTVQQLSHQQNISYSYHQPSYKNSKGNIGVQSSLSTSLQDAIGGSPSAFLEKRSLRGASSSSNNRQDQEDSHHHFRDTSSNYIDSPSSSFHSTVESESESVRKTISRIAETGFSAVDATVATPSPPLFPDYCTLPSPTYASPTLNMKPARTSRNDLSGHQINRKGIKGVNGIVDLDNAPLHPPSGATLLPCLSASTALGIPVTNSLACADLPRLAEAVAAKLELKKELQWKRAEFPDYSVATGASTDDNGNDEGRRISSRSLSSFSSSSSSTSLRKNTQEHSFSFYTPSKAERLALLSWYGGDTFQKDKDLRGKTNKLSLTSNESRKEGGLKTMGSLYTPGSTLNTSSSLGLSKMGSSQSSTSGKKTSGTASIIATAALTQSKLLDWLKPRVFIPLYAPPELGLKHWLECAGIDINSMIHKSILRKALRGTTTLIKLGSNNNEANDGGENESDDSASTGDMQLSAQQLAAVAASASILSPAPFSGPVKQSFLRPSTPIITDKNGGGGGAGGNASLTFSSSSSSLSPLASSSSSIRSGRVILCRSFLGNVLDLVSGSNVLEATQAARNLPTSFYGDPLLTPAGQAAATPAHSTSKRLSLRPTGSGEGKGGAATSVKKNPMSSVSSFDSLHSNSRSGSASGTSVESPHQGTQLFGVSAGDRLWTVLDPYLLVPEYVVDFSYIFEGEDDAEKEAAAAVTAIMLDSSKAAEAELVNEQTWAEKQQKILISSLTGDSNFHKINSSSSSSNLPTASSSSSPSSSPSHAAQKLSSSPPSPSTSSVSRKTLISSPSSSIKMKDKEKRSPQQRQDEVENPESLTPSTLTSELANSLLRLHTLCSHVSSSTSSNFSALSRIERNQLSSSNLGQTFQKAAAMIRKARSIRGGEGGGIEASVSSLTLALQSIANLLSTDNGANTQHEAQKQQTSLLLSLLPPSEEVEIRALLPSLLAFSKLIVDIGSLFLGGAKRVNEGNDEFTESKTHKNRTKKSDLDYPIFNSNLIDVSAIDALSLLPRTSQFVNNEEDENKIGELASTPPWLMAISLPSFRNFIPQESTNMTSSSSSSSLSPFKGMIELFSFLRKLEPLDMFLQTNPSLTGLSPPLSRPFFSSTSASAMSNLTSLSLDGCGLSGQLSSYGISSCSGLRRISIAFNKLTSLCGLSSCAALQEVDASYNLIKTLAIDESKKNGAYRKRTGATNSRENPLSKLEKSDEESNNNEDDYQNGGGKGIKSLQSDDDIYYDMELQHSLQSVFESCHFLQELRLSNNLFVNLNDVLVGVKRRTMLRMLDLRNNPLLFPVSKYRASYLPRILSAFPGLCVLDECIITDADRRLMEAHSNKFRNVSVLEQPELIAKMAVGGEKESRDAFLFQPISKDEVEEEEVDSEGLKVERGDSQFHTRISATDNERYWQSISGVNDDELLSASKESFEVISTGATNTITRYPPLRLSHTLDLSGMFISEKALRTKQAAFTLAAMPCLRKLSLGNNAIRSLVEEIDDSKSPSPSYHFTITALAAATKLTELDLHNCKLRVLAHSGHTLSKSVATSSLSSRMSDLLTDLSIIVPNLVRIHREVDLVSQSTPTAHDHQQNDETIIFDVREHVKRFPLWGYAMTRGAAGICALVSPEEQGRGHGLTDRRRSSTDVDSSSTSSSSSSSSSVSLTIDHDRDDTSRTSEIDSTSPFLTPIVVAAKVNTDEVEHDDDSDDDEMAEDNFIDEGHYGRIRDVRIQQQQQQQQRHTSRQGSSGTSRKSSTTPQQETTSTSNSPFITSVPGLSNASFSPVDLSAPSSSSSMTPSLRSVQFLPLIPLLSPMLASGTYLRKLDLSYNELDDKAVIDAHLELLPNLVMLSLERNRLRTFDGIKGCSGLLELYLGLNEIGSERGGSATLRKEEKGDRDDDKEDEGGRQTDASLLRKKRDLTFSSSSSSSSSSLLSSIHHLGVPSQSSSLPVTSGSSLLASTASPLLRMLRVLASDPIALLSEGGTTSSRNGNTIGVNGTVNAGRTAPFPLLTILDLTGNPIASVEGYREAILRRARKLRVLDGISVTATDLAAAGSDRLNGKLTVEWLEDRASALAEEEGAGNGGDTVIDFADRHGHGKTYDDDDDNNNNDNGGDSRIDMTLTTSPPHPLSFTLDLDYASAHIRDVELLSPLSLPHVRSISLDHNQLTDEGIAGLKLLLYSPTLKSLSLNHNRVLSLFPALGREKGGVGGGGGAPEEIADTIVSLLPLLATMNKDWRLVYGKNNKYSPVTHNDDLLQQKSVGGERGKIGGGDEEEEEVIEASEAFFSAQEKSKNMNESSHQAGSGRATAATSILAAIDKISDSEKAGVSSGQEGLKMNMNPNQSLDSMASNDKMKTFQQLQLPQPSAINTRDIYCRLERLHLVHNGIVSMEGLGLLYLPKLREIDLSHNEISKVAGLAGCKSLSSITLNGNVIRALDLVYLSRSCPLLTHLSVMDNGLRSLTGNAAITSAHSLGSFGHLRHLLSVNFASNRISDINELEPLLLFAASSLISSVSFALNPVCRRPIYRSALLARLPELLSIDGREVQLEERGGGGGGGGGGGLTSAPQFLHQQGGPGGTQFMHPQHQQTSITQQVTKVFQVSGQQQQQQQQQQRAGSQTSLSQQSQTLTSSTLMGPLAMSMIAALNNVKGGEGGGGGGGGGGNGSAIGGGGGGGETAAKDPSSSSVYGVTPSSTVDRLSNDHMMTSRSSKEPLSSAVASSSSKDQALSSSSTSTSVNIGYDALFGAVVNHYKERNGGNGGGGGTVGGDSASYYVMQRGGVGSGRGSIQEKEKSSSGLGTSRGRASDTGLSLTAISLQVPKTGAGKKGSK